MMFSFLTSVLLRWNLPFGWASSGLIPHGHCYLWQSNLIGLHLLSDSAIALAYYSIPLTLVYLVNKREDLPFDWIFLLFGAFIVSCGTTHLFEVWTLWHPDYWLAGGMKAITAVISLITAGVLVMIIPKVLAIPSTQQLQRVNQTLLAEVEQRQRAEAEVRQLNASLEKRVQARTQELEAARLTIERSEQQLRSILTNTPAAIYLKDLTGTIILANQECAALFDKTPEEMEGLTDFDFLPPALAAQVQANDQQVLAQRSPLEFEESIISKDQRKVYLSVKFPLYDAQGQPFAMGGISTDITERKQAEVQLAERAAELTQLNQMLRETSQALTAQNRELDQFSYIVSHDLKAPLRAIANLSEWIEEDLDEVLTEETRQQMVLLRDRVGRMNQMIEGLLNYSRAGRIEHRREPVDVAQLLREVLDLLSPPDALEVEIQLPMPILTTEKLPLNQIFLNLIGNAIKHHDQAQGKIVISAQQLEGNGYEFSVADNGPGIDPRDQERIFKIFETVSSGNGQNTGIGLALVKKIIERQGGKIDLHSQLGQGATFRFTWPSTVS